MNGSGQWVWYVSQSGGSAAAIAERAADTGLDVVYIKSGDGREYWDQFTPRLVGEIQRRGVDVCAWHYVYGTHPEAEAKISARAVKNGADCFVIDAETEYEGRYEEAHAYISELRRLVGPRYPIGLSTFPYVDYHPGFPYSVFLGRGAAQYNLPQVYWRAIGTSVKEAVEHTYVFNRPYDREIFPLGQTYQDPPRKELSLFRRFMNEYRARGESWWSWQETDRREFAVITRRESRGVRGYKPLTSYPLLRQETRGDLVVLAQELLRAHGHRVVVDGVFGRKTRDAVAAFQKSAAIPTTGQIGDRTWAELLKKEPMSTNWSKRGRGTVVTPRSAADPGRSEIPAGGSG